VAWCTNTAVCACAAVQMSRRGVPCRDKAGSRWSPIAALPARQQTAPRYASPRNHVSSCFMSPHMRHAWAHASHGSAAYRTAPPARLYAAPLRHRPRHVTAARHATADASAAAMSAAAYEMPRHAMAGTRSARPSLNVPNALRAPVVRCHAYSTGPQRRRRCYHVRGERLPEVRVLRQGVTAPPVNRFAKMAPPVASQVAIINDATEPRYASASLRDVTPTLRNALTPGDSKVAGGAWRTRRCC